MIYTWYELCLSIYIFSQVIQMSTSFDPQKQISGAPPSTISVLGQRIQVYMAHMKTGRFLNWRKRLSWILLIVFFGTPWLMFSGLPVVKIDAIGRKLIFLGHYYFPTELPTFIPLLFAVIIGAFAVTSTLGRIFCGWICPQTVFLQFVFAPIERWIEGPAHKRREAHAGPMTFVRARRLILKHLLFAVFAFLVANTVLAYFWGVNDVLTAMTTPPAENPFAFGMMLFVNGLFYFIYAHFKEQACVIMCPYARFQSVLADAQTLQVGYDYNRGEGEKGRAKPALRKAAPEVDYGDCIDCGQCTRVCPTGIDIRNGVQLECVGCARCADACDTIMDTIKKPRGLVRYTQQNALECKTNTQVLKPRFWIYASIVMICLSVFVYLQMNRSLMTVDMIRQSGTPYLKDQAGLIVNPYLMKIRNKDVVDHNFTIQASIPGVLAHFDQEKVNIMGAEIKETIVTLRAPESLFKSGQLEFELLIKSEKEVYRKKIRMVGPYHLAK